MNLVIQPLTNDAFKDFGTVMQTKKSKASPIKGKNHKFNWPTQVANLKPGDVVPNQNLFRCTPQAVPVTIRAMERHPYSDMSYVPLSVKHGYLVIVCKKATEVWWKRTPGMGDENDGPEMSTARAFWCRANQAIRFRKGIWHHPMIVFDELTDFAVLCHHEGERKLTADGAEEKLLVYKPKNDLELFQLEKPFMTIQEDVVKKIVKYEVSKVSSNKISNFDLQGVLREFGVKGASVAVSMGETEWPITMSAGKDGVGQIVDEESRFQLCSLSKPMSAMWALLHLDEIGISADTSVNKILQRVGSPFRVSAAKGANPKWADELTMTHLMNHTSSLGIPYCNGFKMNQSFNLYDLIRGQAKHNKNSYPKLEVRKKPGTVFEYSGGGYLLLEHIMEGVWALDRSHNATAVDEMISIYPGCTYDFTGPKHMTGVKDNGKKQDNLRFPAFAAGARGTPMALTLALREVCKSYNGRPRAKWKKSVIDKMIKNTIDKGAVAFMGGGMANGQFVADMGPNKIIYHQAANEGFRGLYFFCVEGPDVGKGMTVLSNGENTAARMNAEIARRLMTVMGFRGLDLTKVPATKSASFKGIKQEEVVNTMLKQLVVGAFAEDEFKNST